MSIFCAYDSRDGGDARIVSSFQVGFVGFRELFLQFYRVSLEGSYRGVCATDSVLHYSNWDLPAEFDPSGVGPWSLDTMPIQNARSKGSRGKR